MVLTPSTMLPLGTRLPSFTLPDYNGRVVSTEDFRDAPALLVQLLEARGGVVGNLHS